MQRSQSQKAVVLISPDRIELSILWIRGAKVLLHEALAERKGSNINFSLLGLLILLGILHVGARIVRRVTGL